MTEYNNNDTTSRGWTDEAWGDQTEPNRPWFQLNIYVSSEDQELKQLYREAITAHNSAVRSCLLHGSHCDAGFDLFCPAEHEVLGGTTVKLNHEIKCSMKSCIPIVPDCSVGYYLYPRSSTGTKTPLRLANSVGIIDSGYRGNIIAVFDNWKNSTYVVEKYNRLVQICPPDLSYPMSVTMLERDDELGRTERGEGGFGSTGT
jgi:dUTP pyrophosphatase